MSVQPSDYSWTKSSRQRFDGADDEPKSVPGGAKLPCLKRRSSTPELRRIGLFQDQNRCITISKALFDGSSDLNSVQQPHVHSKNRSTSSERLRPALKKFQSSDSVRSSGSLRSLDRFLPRRPTSNSAGTSFRSNKDPHTLSPEEKLLRHSGASTDVFSPRRRANSPIPQMTNLVAARRNVSANRSGGMVMDFISVL